MGGPSFEKDPEAEKELNASREREKQNKKKLRNDEFNAMKRAKSGFSLADKASPGDLLGGK